MSKIRAELRYHYCGPASDGKLAAVRQFIKNQKIGKTIKETYHGRRAYDGVHLRHGWYDDCFPLHYRTYYVEDLVSYWRASMKVKFGAECPSDLPWPWFKRADFLQWLKSEGRQRCEDTIYYTVDFWNNVRNRYPNLAEADYPMMNIILGYREGLMAGWEALQRSRESFNEAGDPRLQQARKAKYEEEAAAAAGGILWSPRWRKIGPNTYPDVRRLGPQTELRANPQTLLARHAAGD